MPMALVVAQMADNAFVSAEAIQGVMLGTDQIGLVGSQPRGPRIQSGIQGMQRIWVTWAARRLEAKRAVVLEVRKVQNNRAAVAFRGN